jgi:hypothetical protein
MDEGVLTAVRSEEAVLHESEMRELQKRIKRLGRLLGHLKPSSTKYKDQTCKGIVSITNAELLNKTPIQKVTFFT